MSFIAIAETEVIKPLCQAECYRYRAEANAVIIPHMNSEILERIEKRLKFLKLSASAACISAGLSKDVIRNWKRDSDLMPTTRSLMALAPILKTSVNWLLNGIEDEEISEESGTSSPEGIRFGGIVEAGNFRRVNIFNQDAEYSVIPLQPNPHYPYAAQFAFKVEGESMNLERIHPGMWVHAVEAITWSRLHGEPNDGELVVVEVFRNDNQERELTVKMMRIFRDRVELQPRSSESGHETYVIPHAQYEEFADKYRVKAVVLSSTWLHRYKGM